MPSYLKHIGQALSIWFTKRKGKQPTDAMTEKAIKHKETLSCEEERREEMSKVDTLEEFLANIKKKSHTRTLHSVTGQERSLHKAKKILKSTPTPKGTYRKVSTTNNTNK